MPVFVQNPDPRSLVERPADRLLPADARMGAVELLVRDLDAMIAFYSRGVTLDVLEQSGETAELGRGGQPLVRLRRVRDLPPRRPGEAGLFHTAVLFEDRQSLAFAAASVARLAPQSFTGSSDHLYSEAFYFDDPEGNGVELYVDRPRETWTVADGGEITMGTLALDPNRYLREHLTDAGATAVADTPAVVGHVHLKVGDIATARGFYVDALGFGVTATFRDQALFVSAGGYHHHVGMNTWESRGAGERTPALGLGEVTIALPDTDALGALDERLAHRGIAREFDGHEITVLDPWRNRVKVGVASDRTGLGIGA